MVLVYIMKESDKDRPALERVTESRKLRKASKTLDVVVNSPRRERENV